MPTLSIGLPRSARVRRPASLAILILTAAGALGLALAAAGPRAPVRPDSTVAQIATDSLAEWANLPSSDQDLLKARIGFARRIGI
ncbi:MAG: hypothetical protein U1E21_01285 [Reyranellaceae bacterium]